MNKTTHRQQYIRENLCNAGSTFCYHTLWLTRVNKPLDNIIIATVVNMLPGKYVA